jgi:NADH dehydrogenase
VVIGAGFAGLRAAMRLSRRGMRVVLLDRNNYHLFQPLLYQIATAGLEPEQIAKPVRSVLGKGSRVEFRMAEVTRVDLPGRRAYTDQGEVPYDFLLLAPGGEPEFFALDAVRKHALPLKSLEDAEAVRNHVLRSFELASVEKGQAQRDAHLTFVIVGAGPTGVEMAGALRELADVLVRVDFPGMTARDVRIILVEGKDRVLPAMAVDLGAAAESILRRKRVDVWLGEAVAEYDGQVLRMASGRTVKARTVIWAAGVRAAGIVDTLGVTHGPMGRIRVRPTLQLPEHPEVFVVGDAAYLEHEGAPLPMMAPVASQMADLAADNVLRLVRGEEARPFVYRDPGSLATIGRNAAVAEVAGVRFRGFVAWLVWLLVHLVNLIGFRNRLLVLVTWAWEYLTFDRAVRIITRSGRPRRTSQ